MPFYDNAVMAARECRERGDSSQCPDIGAPPSVRSSTYNFTFTSSDLAHVYVRHKLHNSTHIFFISIYVSRTSQQQTLGVTIFWSRYSHYLLWDLFLFRLTIWAMQQFFHISFSRQCSRVFVCSSLAATHWHRWQHPLLNGSIPSSSTDQKPGAGPPSI